MPRLVRQAPLSERIKAYLDPYDFLLWLSETLNDDTYDEWLKDWATVIGVALNLLFILARGASKAGLSRGADDVFGDDSEGSGSGWFSWFVSTPFRWRRHSRGTTAHDNRPPSLSIY